MSSNTEKPSKSERKRNFEQLQKLGESLIPLKVSDLESLPITDAVREAVITAQSIRQQGALRRQRQYIGKLMRDVDPGPLQVALAALHQPSREENRLHHAAEDWRDRLSREGNDALTALLDAHPGADRQLFHQLQRAVGKAPEGDPGPSRVLYRALRELFSKT